MVSNSELDQHYSKLLDDLKTLEIKQSDSEEADAEENDNESATKDQELNNFRREILGIESNIENLNKIYDDLNAFESHSIETIEKIIKLIAEVAKDEVSRNALIDKNIFSPLNNNVLNNKAINDNTRTQIFRAIGNLCYYNDNGRLKYLESCQGTLQGLFDLCRYCTSNILPGKTDETSRTLIQVALGCLHNVTNENETLRKAAYQLNVMSLLKEFIPFIKESQGILVHFGSCLENLTDMDEGKDQFKNEKLALGLYQSLDENLIEGLDDYVEEFFSILSNINDIETSKTYLFQTDFVELMISIIEKNLDKEDQLRHYCLFLVGLIVKDEKIDVAFDYKNSLILNKSIEWLSNFKHEQLYLTSAVVLANYVRGDEYVLKMIKDPREPLVKLLDVLRQYSSSETSSDRTRNLQRINVSHSLLGALRNFCIAPSTREELLKRDLIKIVIPFLKTYDNLEVKFKALGIIRLMVKSCTDKTGLDLIFSEETLEILENLALDSKDHPGIAGESSRLSTYLPIAAKTERNLQKFFKYKFPTVICDQLKSEHIIMLNEALLALNVIVTVDYRACKDHLKSSNLSDNLKRLFEKEALPFEMRLNSLKLFKGLFDRDDFFTTEQLKEHLEVLKNLANKQMKMK